MKHEVCRSIALLSLLLLGAGVGACTGKQAASGADGAAGGPPDATGLDPVDVPVAASCGNGTVEPGEACDGLALAGMTCSTVWAGFKSGTLQCRPDCSGFDVSGCVAGGQRTAASCSAADVQSALGAAQDGDTVIIPPGTCTWSVTVNLDATLRLIVLKGSGAGATSITAAVEPGLAVDGAEGHGFAISDLGLTRGEHDYRGLIAVTGSANAWRIHHLAVSNQQTDTFRIFGSTYGVIDHVTVTADSWTQFMNVNDTDWTSWQRPMSYGTAQAVFAEDNTVTWSVPGAGIDGQRGCRVVVRHDQLTNLVVSVHGFESGDDAAPLQFEVYDNQFTIEDVAGAWDQNNLTWARLALFRGGSGVLFGNQFTVGANLWLTSPDFALAIFRDDPGFPNSAFQPCDGTQRRFCSNIDKDWTWLGGANIRDCTQDGDCDPGYSCKWKLCSVSHMNLCVADTDCPNGETCSGFIDGPASNTAANDGYPCFMAPGFGSQMHSEPFYAWNNSVSGSVNVPPGAVPLAGEEPQIAEGRDFFNQTVRPGYVSYPYPHPLVQVGR